jgi:hypothetical protein
MYSPLLPGRLSATVSTREELEQLPTSELHDRAMHRARRHLDAKFLWRVIEMVPAARMAAGEPEDAERDTLHVSAQVSEAFTADTDGKLATALRPVYIDYLAEHPDA